MNVPVTSIHIDATRLRQDYGDLKELADSFVNYGQFVPILVKPIDREEFPEASESCEWSLYDGGRRLLAMKLLAQLGEEVEGLEPGEIEAKVFIEGDPIRSLEVEFHGGRVYRYYGVPWFIYKELMGAESVGEHFNDELSAYPIGEKLRVSPGIFGGGITPFAIADDVVYVSVLNFATPYQGDLFDPFAFPGLEFATSEVVALDLATGAPLWTKDLPRASFGAATVVNDLLFTSTNDGIIYALDRATGATLWSDRPGAGINGWPAVAGDMILFPAGIGTNPELIAYRLREPLARARSARIAVVP